MTAFLQRPIEGEWPYVWIDATYVKVRQDHRMAAGVDGLFRHKTRPASIAPLKSAVIDSVVSLTLTVPPGETTHWTAAMMAAASNISSSCRFQEGCSASAKA